MMVSDSGLLFWATLYIGAYCSLVIMCRIGIFCGLGGPEICVFMFLLYVDYGSVCVCVCVCVGFGLIYFNYKTAALLTTYSMRVFRFI